MEGRTNEEDEVYPSDLEPGPTPTAAGASLPGVPIIEAI